MIANRLSKRAERKHNEKIAEIKLEGAREEGQQKATLALGELDALRAKSPYSWPQVLFMFLLSLIISACIGHFLYGIYIYPIDSSVLAGWERGLNILESVPSVLGLIIAVVLTLMGSAVLANRLIK